MKLHEHQAKQLFRDFGIPVPEGRVAATADEARVAAEALGGGRWIVKAQVHAGGRGKAGGVRVADSPEAVAEAAADLLGTRLVTAQTGPEGLPVHAVLVERPVSVARELYLGVLVDRGRDRIAFIASDAGGMEIEQVAAERPEAIRTVHAGRATGFQPYQGRRLGFALGLDAGQVRAFTAIATGLYRLFTECDASLVEINPLVVTSEGGLLALDAKVSIDDNALWRQERLASLRDESQEEPREREARAHGLSYVALDGDIGCMVNGAGLAMATMDLIKLQGGEPANFLDVGGTATPERVAEAFKLILADGKVRAILVNIFGGIVRCDVIADGILEAVRQVEVRVPVVVRLEGTNAEAGRARLAESGLDIIAAADLTEAAQKAVRAARGGTPA